jgi:EamA domain-containing membrane protein RarD
MLIQKHEQQTNKQAKKERKKQTNKQNKKQTNNEVMIILIMVIIQFNYLLFMCSVNSSRPITDSTEYM